MGVAVLGLTSISDEIQYGGALEEFGRLMTMAPKVGMPERERHDALATILEAYESEHYPMELPDPSDAIVFYLDQHSKGSDALLPFLGSMEDIDAILQSRRELSLDEIRALHDGLGISAEILIRKPTLQRIEYSV